MNKSPFLQCLVPLIQAPEPAGLFTVALAADVIAADARFNDWFSQIGKQEMASEKILNFVDRIDLLATSCASSVSKFRENRDCDALNRALEEIANDLNDARKLA
jgi:hypothetical protein